MLYVDYPFQKVYVCPSFGNGRDILHSILQSNRHEYLSKVPTRPKQQRAVRHDRYPHQDVNAIHECSDAISYFSAESPGILEVVDLALHLDEVAHEGEQSCRREDLTEEDYESELLDQLHVFTNDVCFLIRKSEVSECLESSDTELVIFVALHLFNWRLAVWFVLVQSSSKLFLDRVDLRLEFPNRINVLSEVRIVLLERHLSTQHDEYWLILTFEECDGYQWSVEIEEVEQEHFVDEGIIMRLLVLMVLVVGDH